MAEVTVAAVQFSCDNEVSTNIARAEALVRSAKAKGAQVILLQELFSSVYFPIDQIDCSHLAVSFGDDCDGTQSYGRWSSYVAMFQHLAEELQVVLPISYYERCKYVPYSFDLASSQQ